MASYPIYKDTYYTTTADTLVYRITIDGGTTIIYGGRAVKMPGSNRIRVKINDICRNFLSSDLSTLLTTSATTQTQPYACRLFTLTDLTDNITEQYRFLLDWSYTSEWSGETGTLSNPINGHYVEGTKLVYTMVDGSGLVVTFAANNGLYTTPVCASKQLYYLNSRAGWDVFAIEGACKPTDKYTTYTTERAYDNNTVEFGEDRYLAEIRRTWELNTGYLTDEEAARLVKELLPSNKVYMLDVESGEFMPVVLTNESVALQTYATNGRKMAQYKITARESQEKIRI